VYSRRQVAGLGHEVLDGHPIEGIGEAREVTEDLMSGKVAL
jgi:hypothetical protein